MKLIIAERLRASLQTLPFLWGEFNNLFAANDIHTLCASFPTEHFHKMRGQYTGKVVVENKSNLTARPLIALGEEEPKHQEDLVPIWRTLIDDVLSDEYREHMSRLSGLDLLKKKIEINLYYYFAGAWLAPHVDLKEKLVTHICYFNESWQPDQGGCLCLLNSENSEDIYHEINPTAGNSAVIVRSENSWHAMKPIAQGQPVRRSMTITFYPQETISPIWKHLQQ